ncbi:hypothetical protein DYB31_011329, partial [Aphanomyces astaci]
NVIRDDAVACQILSTLLDGRDGGAAAEVFGRTQRWDVASRRSSQLTHVYVNHPHTSAKAARRHLSATSSQIPTHDIADHAHQLSLVQATLDTPLTVHLVETSSQMERMLTWMDRATNEMTMVVVGLDCEWRPRAFNPTRVDGHNDDLYDLGVTVVQLAFPNGHVFVLDCMATCVMMSAVFDRLCRPWIVVTGFCVSGDLDRLVGSYPALARTFQSPHWTCVDLRRVAMARVRRLAGVGLASLASTFLNHTMPKHQQCSDWAARPLTADLMHVFGYSRGSIGPVGLRCQARVHVVVDVSLVHEASVIYCGAGARHRVVALCPSQLIALSPRLAVSTCDVGSKGDI